MKGSGSFCLCAGDIMMVNFREIYEIAVLVSEFSEVLVINNIIVDEFTYGLYISNVYDA
jgi:hypothetical protein